MKIKILLTSFFCIITGISLAQDVIVFREYGSELKTKVLEITDSSVKYKKWDNVDGPTYTISISTISRIKYQNGQEDVFESKNISNIKTQSSTVQNKSSVNNYDSVLGYPKLPLVNVPYYINNMEILELETAEFKIKKQHAGIWGSIYVKSISGISSNVRFFKKNQPKFIIQLEDSKSNPLSVCELDLCEVKAQREFIDSKQGAHGIEKQSGLKLEFEKLSETGLYLITVSKSMSKGEYFFSILNQTDVYAFGIDK